MLDLKLSPHPITKLDTQPNQTGTWRAFRPVYQQLTSPCRETCPAGSDIPRWIDLVRAGEYRQAWEILTEDNPFPATLGRICAAPCETACNRGSHDQPTNIHGLEQFLGDRAVAEGWAFPEPPAAPASTADAVAGRSIAVVGGGPAGLTCAYQLRRMGYAVKLFEGNDRLGGLLTHGIPSYSLKPEVAEAEVQRILNTGIEVVTGVRAGVDISWADLRQQHAAVFMSIGATNPAVFDLPGSSLPGVLDGIKFLAEVRAGRQEAPGNGGPVVVIGAGATGINAARTLRRLGAQVMIVTSEAEQKVRSRAAAALEEGAALLADEEALEILGTDAVTGIRLKGDHVIPAAAVILAAGRMGDLEIFPEEAELDDRMGLAADPFTSATCIPGFFAGGDVTGTRRTVEAVGMGKRAAAAIHAYLEGVAPAEALDAARLGESPNMAMRAYTRPESYPAHLAVNLHKVVGFGDIETIYFPHKDRVERSVLPAAERVRSFGECEVGLTEAEALQEASRCFNCGSCIGCDNCLVFCPDMAISKRPDGYGYTVDLDHCKGCGVCVNECPREALSLREEVK